MRIKKKKSLIQNNIYKITFLIIITISFLDFKHAFQNSIDFIWFKKKNFVVVVLSSRKKKKKILALKPF